MNKTMFTKGAIPVLEQAISFAGQRHRVIASNIANVMTPFYKSKDLPEAEFQMALNRAIDERRTGDNPRAFNFRPVSSNMFVDRYGGARFNEVYSGDVNIVRHDGNNVDIDMEMSNLARNAMMHKSLIQLLNHDFMMIDTAIIGRSR